MDLLDRMLQHRSINPSPSPSLFYYYIRLSRTTHTDYSPLFKTNINRDHTKICHLLMKKRNKSFSRKHHDAMDNLFFLPLVSFTHGWLFITSNHSILLLYALPLFYQPGPIFPIEPSFSTFNGVIPTELWSWDLYWWNWHILESLALLLPRVTMALEIPSIYSC